MVAERRQTDLSQLFSEEYLRTHLAELDSRRASLEIACHSLSGRIIALRRQLQPLLDEEHALRIKLDGLNEKRKPIEQGLLTIERGRQRRDFIQAARQRLQEGAKALGQLDNQVVQELGRVVKAISDDERFLAVLPELYEQGLAETRVFHNGDRISVRGNDGCRLALFGDGSYGIIYNPKPYMELQTNAVLNQVEVSEGFFVDRHVLGIRIDPTQELPVIRPFALVRSVDEGQASHMTFSSSPELLAPVLNVISGILAQGEISLPKKFGLATIREKISPIN